MNILECLRRVNDVIDDASKEELQTVIMDLARSCEIDQRREFVNNIEKDLYDQRNRSSKGLGFKEQSDYLQLQLRHIGNNQVFIKEELSDNDNDDGEYCYVDEDGIVKTITDSISYINKALESKQYTNAYAVASTFMDNVVDIRVESVNESGFIPLVLLLDAFFFYSQDRMKEILISLMQAAYFSNGNEKRLDAIYKVHEYSNTKMVKMDSFLQSLNVSVEEMEGFLCEWILYLMYKPTKRASILLNEAITTLNDPRYCLMIARQYPDVSLQVINQAFELFSYTDDEIIDYGYLVLEHSDPRFIMRSDLACRIALSALRKDSIDLAKKCFFEAFVSNSNPMNYIRLLHAFDCDEYQKMQLEKILLNHQFDYKTPNIHKGAYLINHITKFNWMLLCFLQGRFSDVVGLVGQTRCKETNQLYQVGNSLLLLYLYNGDHLGDSCMSVAYRLQNDMHATIRAYTNSLNMDIKDSEHTKLIDQWFVSWKNTLQPSQPMDIQCILRVVEDFIDAKVMYVLNNQLRELYYECALYLSAYGEVLESLGFITSKQQILLLYGSRYHNYSAFTNTLLHAGLS